MPEISSVNKIAQTVWRCPVHRMFSVKHMNFISELAFERAQTCYENLIKIFGWNCRCL